MKPFENFIEQSPAEVEKHLGNIGIKGAREQRMRGAREFARFLVGRPQQKHEITKGRPIAS